MLPMHCQSFWSLLSKVCASDKISRRAFFLFAELKIFQTDFLFFLSVFSALHWL